MSDAKKEFEYVRYITPGIHDDTAKGGFRNYQCAWPIRQEWMGPDVTEVVHASWREQAEKLAEALRKCSGKIGFSLDDITISTSSLQDTKLKTAERALAEFEKWKGQK